MNGILGVILVNYNSWRDTIECVSSLRRLRYASVRIYIVDNGSSDDSCHRIRAEAPEARLISLPTNLGFAGGCNTGLRAAVADSCEYMWLLNNDTVVTPESAGELVTLARSRPDMHFFGCLVSFFHRPDLLWFGGGRFNRWTGGSPHVGYLRPAAELVGEAPAETNWITGCSLFIRSDSICHVGWMDEDFFLYVEDLEWQIRAGGHMPRALILQKNMVRHKVGRSTGTTDGRLGRAFMSRNFIKMAFRHAGYRLPLWLAWWALWYCVVPLLRGRWALLNAAVKGACSQAISGPELLQWLKDRG